MDVDLVSGVTTQATTPQADDEHSASRPRVDQVQDASQPESLPPPAQAAPRKFPTGIIFAAVRNSKRRFFLADTDNIIGGMVFKNIMVDTGRGSHLLPMGPTDLDELARRFKDKDWKLSLSKGVHSSCPVLLIQGGMAMFSACLCRSVLEAPVEIHLNQLRFHVCGDDFKKIATTPELMQRFTAAEQEVISIHSRNSTVPRRTHALLGQNLINPGVALVQLDDITVAMDIQATFFRSFKDIRGLPSPQDLERQGVLPENFNDLEDEDHDQDEGDLGSFLLWGESFD